MDPIILEHVSQQQYELLRSQAIPGLEVSILVRRAEFDYMGVRTVELIQEIALNRYRLSWVRYPSEVRQIDGHDNPFVFSIFQTIPPYHVDQEEARLRVATRFHSHWRRLGKVDVVPLRALRLIITYRSS